VNDDRPGSAKDLRDRDAHFDFGANWASYARLIGQPQIDEAVRGLEKMLPAGAIAGRSFLDIGSGSGLHSLAALRLGAAVVRAIDIDEDSVASTRAVLTEHARGARWSAEIVSVFDLDPALLGTFNVVYSWGVLHHTGDMDDAVRKAAAMVGPDGLLALALYRRTRLDRLWVAEKRWYAKASSASQARARWVYINAMRIALRLRGRSLKAYRAGYRSFRGMDLEHDVHDWLGGYPYESVMPDDVERLLEPLGFVAESIPEVSLRLGASGSGCDEYVYRRRF
jgi:2-polyprenyl-3-methyl-5-hydroxy-6-metoxy-1,4-benzoquinol methylase